MARRFVTIWFKYLKTDWVTLRKPELANKAFVLALPSHGKMMVTATNKLAAKEGIEAGMAVADARAIYPALEVLDDRPELSDKLLKGIAKWCIRYTPVVAIDLPDGLILDASGCAHLWGGDAAYVKDIIARLKQLGYAVKAAMADTIGAAWAVTHYCQNIMIVASNEQSTTLLDLPAPALRLDPSITERLQKLGLGEISSFMHLPKPSLRRRFGQQLLLRLHQALGLEEEPIVSLEPVMEFQERLPCMDPIVHAKGIEIAIERLLQTICGRLQKEGKGLRKAILHCHRIEGKIEQIEIGTHRPSSSVQHLFSLFEIKISSITPGLGIELFIMDAPVVEISIPVQEALWNTTSSLDAAPLSELLDRIEGKLGPGHIFRYMPDEHYWPERSCKPATSIHEKLTIPWKNDRPRPLQILNHPERIEVTAPIPDYPPMLFRYKGKLHKIMKADGPERIEQEWWLQEGKHRDYYAVEDEDGRRYWLFRLGHYDAAKTYEWFMHGFFA